MSYSETFNHVDVGDANTASDLQLKAHQQLELEQRLIFAGRMKAGERSIKNYEKGLKKLRDRLNKDKEKWTNGDRDFTPVGEGEYY